MNPWELPDPNDLPAEDINEYYREKIYGGMDPEKDDKNDEVTQEELDNIDKFLKRLDEQNLPPSID